MDWQMVDLMRRLSFLLLPGRCLLCQSASGRTMDLCPGCEADLPWLNDHQCAICALPLPGQSIASEPSDIRQVCGSCLKCPPPFERCRAPFLYQPPINRLVNGFKHHHQMLYGELLAELFCRWYQRPLPDRVRPDMVAPVPLHWRRRWRRGFNQSAILAQYISRHLDLPCDHQLLRRAIHSAPHQQLNRRQRQQDLRRAFQVKRALAGERIALIDDVVTTGSTAIELGNALLEAGAGGVEIWCLARTPLDK